MRVLDIQVDNFMRLVTAHVEPTGSVVEIAGKNGQGKTSLLNAIQAAVGGGNVLPEQPIRKGEKTATIRVKLGDGQPTLIVTRTFTANEDGGYRTEILLEAPDGARYSKPQTQLDALYGALTFDPFAFTRLKPREQLEQLRAFVPGVDFDAIDEANKGDFERRKETNRQLTSLKARLGAITVPGDPRVTRIDESALVAELEAAGKVRAEIVAQQNSRAALAKSAEDRRREASGLRIAAREHASRIEDLLLEIDGLKAAIAQAEGKAAEADEFAERTESMLAGMEPIPAEPDTASLLARIDAARKTNADVAERERVLKDRERLVEEVSATEKKVATYTARIDKRNQEKHDAVAAAALPIEGLGFAEDGVLFNGIPFEQASTAEQLRVSVAIAAAVNSKLKVMLVRDGSLLDDDSMALLRELAEKSGHQVWVEVVSSESAGGILIEDGRVASVGEVAA